MSTNMSRLDRGLRSSLIAPAAIVIAILVGAGSIAGVLLFALAGVMLATSAIGFCPLYALRHFDTRGRRALPH
jgi:Protein of unknown function (DUF2892)